MRQALGASQKALDGLEFASGHVGCGEVVKALPDKVFEFILVFREACNPMQ
jgi:hypothetical protein